MTWKKFLWTSYKEIMMSANVELKRVREWAWMRGFASLYQKESRAWWSTRRWWINGLLWLGLVVGFVIAWMFIFPPLFGDQFVAQQGGLVNLGLQAVFDMATLAITIGVIVLCQDLIIGEMQTGLTEGLLAKPVQRRAYVLAKLCASLVAVLLLLIALPCAAAYGVISLGTGGPIPLQPFLAGMGILGLNSLFYLTLTLMLGVFCNSRSLILGIPLGFYFIGSIFSGVIKPLLFITPWIVPKFATAIASSQPILPGLLWPPLLATGLWCAVFTCAALIKFERTEF
jgi:ABC-type transport system involved in multi-copper enzyme maturation permease subunit